MIPNIAKANVPIVIIPSSNFLPYPKRLLKILSMAPINIKNTMI